MPKKWNDGLPSGLILNMWPSERGDFTEYWKSHGKIENTWIKITDKNAIIKFDANKFHLISPSTKEDIILS
jgi:hypothetical protein